MLNISLNPEDNKIEKTPLIYKHLVPPALFRQTPKAGFNFELVVDPRVPLASQADRRLTHDLH